MRRIAVLLLGFGMVWGALGAGAGAADAEIALTI